MTNQTPRLTSGTRIPGRHRLAVNAHQRATRLGDQLDLAAQWAITAGLVLLIAMLVATVGSIAIYTLGHVLQAVFPR